jgi:hypothetical protein
MYYRLYDNQTGRIMATGNNAKSKKDLAEQYVSYKSIDANIDGLEDDFITLSKMPVNEVMEIIKGDDFEIEKSKRKFADTEF